MVSFYIMLYPKFKLQLQTEYQQITDFRFV